jgi:hypothetical protein
MSNGFEYRDAGWGFIDLPKRLESILRCKIEKISDHKTSMECHYIGFWGHPAKCGLEIEKKNKKIDVTLTELPDNPGTSVTNMVEQLATMVYHEFLYDTPVENIRWLEHYPERGTLKESLDEVEMLWDDVRFSKPKWKRLKYGDKTF